ncbi:hypothetical protein FNH05_21295 [Amycolatopsis rhizosphaerae]|uniref:Uncharacterized protein n=1 Tax=Amycolatopsis rhizosphaerae TaxID=2053003 RepID=A0A558C6Z3_9PSEU|nr:hypothetical protein [Amycolatopsis rhizosphaerae]TVT44560.1 hypothetical protein FNH05_21295 [Amycolatopsis rhizosphaerae]
MGEVDRVAARGGRGGLANLHTTCAKVDAASTDVINGFAKLDVAGMWGERGVKNIGSSGLYSPDDGPAAARGLQEVENGNSANGVVFCGRGVVVSVVGRAGGMRLG